MASAAEMTLAMVRASELLELTGKAALQQRSETAMSPYDRAAYCLLVSDAVTLKAAAMQYCPHPDGSFYSAEDCEEGCTHCNLCGKTWPEGAIRVDDLHKKGRDDV